MKTLNDYILDAQRKEARFLSDKQGQWKAYETSRNTQANVSALIPNLVYVTRDGRSIPCHNKATYDFYKREEEAGRTF